MIEPLQPVPDWYERFMEKVDVSDELFPGGCWLWTGSLDGVGYGQFRISPKGFSSHRLSYNLFVGPIPEGLYVLHSCDVRPCVNPEHLWVGTHAENMEDMASKGRSVRGIKNHTAVLTEDMVIEIRRVYATGKTDQDTLAEQYGVASCTLSQVITGRNWPHLPGVIPSQTHGNALLTKDQVIRIRETYAAGNVTQVSLADEYGLNRTTINKIINRKSYKDI